MNPGPLVRRALALAAAVAVLDVCGRGPLAGPPAHVSTLLAWLRDRPPAEAAIALIRLATLGAGIYLLVVVAVALVGCASGLERMSAMASRFSPRALHPLLALATTASVALGATTAMAGTAHGAGVPVPGQGPGRAPEPAPTLRRVSPSPGPVNPPVLRQLPPSTTPSTTAPATTAPPTTAPATTAPETIAPATNPTPATAPRTAPVVSSPGDAEIRAGLGRGTGATPHRPPVQEVRPQEVSQRAASQHRAPRRRPTTARAERDAEQGPTTYVVRPGDSFWSIAEARVGAAADITTGPEEVARYWWTLIQVNRTDLPVPGHPDLLFPGDRLRLPPVTSGQTSISPEGSATDPTVRNSR